MCAKTTILLWLAAIVACCGGNTITIGDKEYTKTDLVKDGAKYHIVINNGHVLHRNFGLNVMNLETRKSHKAQGLDHIAVQDLAVDGTGVVWVATEDGLYKMDSVNSNATYVTGNDKDLWCVAVDSTYTVYVAEYMTEDVYVFRDNALHKVPGIKAKSIAFSNDGDVYYIKGSSNRVAYKKKGILATEATKITMPEPFNTWTLELDKKTDTLYILSWCDHVFYVPAGGTAAFQVDGLSDTKAIGTDDQGNIYVGTDNEICKLTPIPIEKENVV